MMLIPLQREQRIIYLIIWRGWKVIKRFEKTGEIKQTILIKREKNGFFEATSHSQKLICLCMVMRVCVCVHARVRVYIYVLLFVFYELIFPNFEAGLYFKAFVILFEENWSFVKDYCKLFELKCQSRYFYV